MERAVQGNAFQRLSNGTAQPKKPKLSYDQAMSLE